MSQGSENIQKTICFVQAFSEESYSSVKQLKKGGEHELKRRGNSYHKWVDSSVLHLNAALRLKDGKFQACVSRIRLIYRLLLICFLSLRLCRPAVCLRVLQPPWCAATGLLSLINLHLPPPRDQRFTNGDVYPINVLFSEKIPPTE